MQQHEMNNRKKDFEEMAIMATISNLNAKNNRREQTLERKCAIEWRNQAFEEK